MNTVKKETLEFQAETQQLLNLMIHSLYSEKEIFLRELISNASDAADKLRFMALKDDKLYESDADLAIRIEYDKDNKTVTISDNGIGMSRQDVSENLGVIARSGTKEFCASLTGDQAKDSQMIGQFGVGFYAAFMVADQIIVSTRKAGLPKAEGVRWSSVCDGNYAIETISKAKRGTTIVLHLKDNAVEFLDGLRLRHIIKKYSDHISLPIIMQSEKTENAENTDENIIQDITDETINTATALWMRNKKDIKQEEYHEFYKHIAHDFEDPLIYSHNRVEGKLDYTNLIYIPKRAPFDMWDRKNSHGLKLYVRRIFIMDDAEHLLPAYLRFVRGIVDSNDLPLNVSREILQKNKMIDSIRAGIIKKVLDMLAKMAQDQKEQYAIFWKEFGRVLKESLLEEHDKNKKEILANLFRFTSSHTDQEEQSVTLADYVSRMVKNQEKIYYVIADSFAAAKNSPHLEIFRENSIEVLLLSDPIDEWLISHLSEFKDHKLQSVTKGELDLGKLIKEKKQEKKEDTNPEELVEKIHKVLAEKVQSVRATDRLRQSPVCLVADEHGMELNLERILKASGQNVPGNQNKPILEINTQHPLLLKLNEIEDQQLDDWAHILFDQALLSAGGQLEDPVNFVHRLNGILLSMNEDTVATKKASPSDKKVSKKKANAKTASASEKEASAKTASASEKEASAKTASASKKKASAKKASSSDKEASEKKASSSNK